MSLRRIVRSISSTFTTNSLPTHTPSPDFEKLGYATMTQTRDFEATRHICGLEIQAFAHKVEQVINDLGRAIAEKRQGVQALHCDLYERDQPVRDSQMLSHEIVVSIFATLTIATVLASMGSQFVTFYLMGRALHGLGMALFVTTLSLVIGYLAFERLLSRSGVLQVLVISLGVLIGTWGFAQWAQTRAIVATHTDASGAGTSYVDGTEAPEEPAHNQSDEQTVRQMQQKAWFKILLGADILVGIFLGLYNQKKTERDYVAWRKVKSLQDEIAVLESGRDSLGKQVAIAEKKCMAGILRALHTPKRKHVPYFRLSVFVLLAGLPLPPHAHAQNITRQEGILIDTSRSIERGSDQELFRKYLQGVRHRLATEPPGSQVVVCVIATDSFGGTHELLKGWTPDVHGVFTDELTRARRQLVSTFVSKSSTLAPNASGTDIIGALWRMKATLESGDYAGPGNREIWIWSDMMNDTPTLSLPKLIELGPSKILEFAKERGLVVSLQGYKIHVLGASTRRLSPQGWNTAKGFWEEYFRVAGAELVSYSVEQ